MKIMFLDHDGVICLSSEWGGRFKNKEGLDSVFDRFNDKAIKVLNEIIDATDCEIVVSSDWKYHATLEQMRELYKIRGIKKLPIDFTPESNGTYSRVSEIKTWLAENSEKYNVTHWVAVDDINMTEGLTNFVYTPRSNEGIKQNGVKEKIIKFLS